MKKIIITLVSFMLIATVGIGLSGMMKPKHVGACKRFLSNINLKTELCAVHTRATSKVMLNEDFIDEHFVIWWDMRGHVVSIERKV